MSPGRDHDHASGRCREIFERLSEYLDGELPADLCDRVDAHMADCPPCEALLRSLGDTVALIREVDAPGLTDEVRNAVKAAYRRFRSDPGSETD